MKIAGEHGFEIEKEVLSSRGGIPDVAIQEKKDTGLLLPIENRDRNDEKEIPKAWEEGDKISTAEGLSAGSQQGVGKESADTSNELEEIKSSKVRDRFVFFIGVILFLSIVGAAGLALYYYNGNKWAIQKEPEKVAEPTPTEVVKIQISKDSNIKILNASGVVGAAGKLKKYFESNGYTKVETGNADDPVVGSSINLPESVELSDELRTLLSEYGLDKLTTGQSSSNLIEIIIGKK